MAVERDRLATYWWTGVLALILIGGALGFVLLPAPRAGTLWDSFCAAVGLPVRNAQAVEAAQAANVFAFTAAVEDRLAAGDAGRGQAAAAMCGACHGETGIGVTEVFPNLAGQPRHAIAKQLHDYRSGRRVHAMMSAMAAPLSDEQIADLAAYYASLPGDAAPSPRVIPRLAAVGDPMRNIAPCGACHGAHGTKEGAPPLGGQKIDYLAAQMRAFADGSRHNDIHAQMRTVARALRPEEIDGLAAFYAGDNGAAR